MKSDWNGLHFQREHFHRWTLKFWMEMKRKDGVDQAHPHSFTYLSRPSLQPAAEQRQQIVYWMGLYTHIKGNVLKAVSGIFIKNNV